MSGRWGAILALVVGAGCLEPLPIGSGEYVCGTGCAWGFVCDGSGETPVCVVLEDEPQCIAECELDTLACRDGEKVICRRDASDCPRLELTQAGCGVETLCITDGRCNQGLFWSTSLDTIDGELHDVWVETEETAYLAGDRLYRFSEGQLGVIKDAGRTYRAIAGERATPPLVFAVGDAGLVTYGVCPGCPTRTVGAQDLLGAAFEPGNLGRAWAVGKGGAVAVCDGAGCQAIGDLPLVEPLPALRAVTITDDGTVYIAGDRTLLQRLRGNWRDLSTKVLEFEVYAVSATMLPTGLVLAGASNRLKLFDGAELITLGTPSGLGGSYLGVFASSPVDVWFVGQGAGGTEALTAHYDGEALVGRKTGLLGATFTAVHGTSRANVWRVGNDREQRGFIQRTRLGETSR
ncbi:MAG: hypothetical protein ACI9MR_002394 [Myxococcota bacterium]|jgi:hypothetical protein